MHRSAAHAGMAMDGMSSTTSRALASVTRDTDQSCDGAATHVACATMASCTSPDSAPSRISTGDTRAMRTVVAALTPSAPIELVRSPDAPPPRV